MGWFTEQMAITTEQEHIIIDNARQWAATVRLDSEDDFYTAVNQQLAQLKGSNMRKRRDTIKALGESAVNPEISRASIFRRPTCISEKVFYSTEKDWFHGRNFRTVLERVIALYLTWESIKQLKTIEKRQAEWREKSYNIGNNMAQVAMNMLGTDLYEVVKDDEDGREVTVMPAKWAFRDAATLATAADKLVRLSLDMPTDKHEIDADIHETEKPRETLRLKLTQLRQGMGVDTAVADDSQEEADD